MPQLDRVIVFTQIFWLLIVILVAYNFVIQLILPNSFRILRTRTRFIKDLFNNIEVLNKEQDDQFKKTIKLNKNYISVVKNLVLMQNEFYDKVLTNYYKKFFMKTNFNKVIFTHINFIQLYKDLVWKSLIDS
nr:ATP synthase F0 subunit 8 [Cyanidioschyzonaceae sp. 1 FvB-2021]